MILLVYLIHLAVSVPSVRKIDDVGVITQLPAEEGFSYFYSRVGYIAPSPPVAYNGIDVGRLSNDLTSLESNRNYYDWDINPAGIGSVLSASNGFVYITFRLNTFVLMKFSTDLEYQWSFKYAHVADYMGNPVETDDGNLVFVGRTATYKTATNENAMIFKINSSDGSVMWAFHMGVTNTVYAPKFAIQKIVEDPNDKGLICFGSFTKTNRYFWAIKLSSDGQTILWNTRFSYGLNPSASTVNRAILSADGQRTILGGYYIENRYDTVGNKGYEVGVIISVDNTFGNYTTFGQYRHDSDNYKIKFSDIIEMADYGYLAVGMLDIGGMGGTQRGIFLRTDVVGNIIWAKQFYSTGGSSNSGYLTSVNRNPMTGHLNVRGWSNVHLGDIMMEFEEEDMSGPTQFLTNSTICPEDNFYVSSIQGFITTKLWSSCIWGGQWDDTCYDINLLTFYKTEITTEISNSRSTVTIYSDVTDSDPTLGMICSDPEPYCTDPVLDTRCTTSLCCESCCPVTGNGEYCLGTSECCSTTVCGFKCCATACCSETGYGGLCSDDASCCQTPNQRCGTTCCSSGQCCSEAGKSGLCSDDPSCCPSPDRRCGGSSGRCCSSGSCCMEGGKSYLCSDNSTCCAPPGIRSCDGSSCCTSGQCCVEAGKETLCSTDPDCCVAPEIRCGTSCCSSGQCCSETGYENLCSEDAGCCQVSEVHCGDVCCDSCCANTGYEGICSDDVGCCQSSEVHCGDVCCDSCCTETGNEDVCSTDSECCVPPMVRDPSTNECITEGGDETVIEGSSGKLAFCVMFVLVVSVILNFT